MRAKILLAASAAILLSLVCADGASARDGCGPGLRLGRVGCIPDRGSVVVAPGAPVVVAPAAPVVVAPVVCGRGYGWHPGFRRCVVL
jgi:hypothetical protein